MTGQGQGQVGIRATPPVLMDHAVCFVLGGVIKQAGDAVNGLPQTCDPDVLNAAPQPFVVVDVAAIRT